MRLEGISWRVETILKASRRLLILIRRLSTSLGWLLWLLKLLISSTLLSNRPLINLFLTKIKRSRFLVTWEYAISSVHSTKDYKKLKSSVYHYYKILFKTSRKKVFLIKFANTLTNVSQYSIVYQRTLIQFNWSTYRTYRKFSTSPNQH